LHGTVVPGELLVTASTLTGVSDAAVPEVTVEGVEVSVSWSDGARTTCTWSAAVPVVATTR
jgi:hypothetical protein